MAPGPAPSPAPAASGEFGSGAADLHVVAPPLKWPGGKTRERARILATAPLTWDRYFEPFVGGGAVYWGVPSTIPAWINDTSVDLVDLYRGMQDQDPALFAMLDAVVVWWEAVGAWCRRGAPPLVATFRAHPDAGPADMAAMVERDVVALAAGSSATIPASWQDLDGELRRTVEALVPPKVARMRALERRRGQRLSDDDLWANVEGALRAAVYTTLRAAYNRCRKVGERSPARAALFFTLREFAYGSMFRFNAAGEFNVPYGGISYNRKDLAAKVDHLRSPGVVARLASTTIECLDFEAFLELHQPDARTWMFLDPPYDSDFSTYDRRPFGPAHHRRLAAVMRSLDCMVQLVIKATPTVREVYVDDHWCVRAFDTTYAWTVKDRNDREATHLVITNYDPDEGKRHD